MDRLGIYLNNVTNEVVSAVTGDTIPVTRKFGHPWFHVSGTEAQIAYLSEAELRRLHARFGHPSVDRLRKLLTRAGHNVDYNILEIINKFYYYY